MRHCASLLLGIMELLFSFGLLPTLYLLSMAFTAFIFMKTAYAKLHPNAVFCYVMLWELAAFHFLFFLADRFLIFFRTCSSFYYYHYYYAQWLMDITSPLMITVQKITELAWNLYDGRLQQKAIEENNGKPLKEEVLKTSYQRRMAITQGPNFFEYLAYILFPININYGPATEYKMYADSVNRTEPLLKCRIPLFWEQFILGMCSMVYFTHPTDLSYMRTKEFMAKPLIKRIIWVNLAMNWTRLKFADIRILPFDPLLSFLAYHICPLSPHIGITLPGVSLAHR